MILEIIITIFAIFAISRSWLRLKHGNESMIEFLFWTIIWTIVVIIVFAPSLTTIPARILNIDRGIDAFVYLGIVLLFYLVYRMYSKIEHLEQDITKLTRTIAIKEGMKIKTKKMVKNK